MFCMRASTSTDAKADNWLLTKAKRVVAGTVLTAGALGATAHVTGNLGAETPETRTVIKELHYADAPPCDEDQTDDDLCFPRMKSETPDGQVPITTGIEAIEQLDDETIKVQNFGTDLALGGSANDPQQVKIIGTIIDSENPEITRRGPLGDTFADWLGSEEIKFIPRKRTSIETLQGKHIELKGSKGEQNVHVKKNLPKSVETVSIDLTDGGADTVVIEDASHPASIKIKGAKQVIIYNANALASRVQLETGSSAVVVRKLPYENLKEFKTALEINPNSRGLIIPERHWEPFSETVEAYTEKTF